jgi:hypothetical protein
LARPRGESGSKRSQVRVRGLGVGSIAGVMASLLGSWARARFRVGVRARVRVWARGRPGVRARARVRVPLLRGERPRGESGSKRSQVRLRGLGLGG